MKIGVPKEIKDQEFRVGLSPQTVRTLVEAGHQVSVETQAGAGSGFDDRSYTAVGATIVPDGASAWSQDLVVKVKEPLPQEYQFLRQPKFLFTYLHLAADPTLTEALIDSGITAIAYESVELPNGRFPLLEPMSIIAGRLAVQFGARFLERSQGGRGVLLGGVPGVAPGQVMILGGGVVGTEAARMAVGLGAKVQILDVNVDRLAYLETLFGSRVELLYSTSAQIAQALPHADLLVGAVLLPGRRPPQLVTRELVAQMRPGAVIVDVAVDQGGCVETLRPTSHTQPTYEELGVVHYGVPNMPGAVPWTATQALNNATSPYVVMLAQKGSAALDLNAALGKGVAVHQGALVHPVLRDVFPDLAATIV